MYKILTVPLTNRVYNHFSRNMLSEEQKAVSISRECRDLLHERDDISEESIKRKHLPAFLAWIVIVMEISMAICKNFGGGI
jgi:hypothetical protein